MEGEEEIDESSEEGRGLSDGVEETVLEGLACEG